MFGSQVVLGGGFGVEMQQGRALPPSACLLSLAEFMRVTVLVVFFSFLFVVGWSLRRRQLVYAGGCCCDYSVTFRMYAIVVLCYGVALCSALCDLE